MKKILITTAIILFTVSSLVAFLHTVKTNKNSVNLMFGNVEALAGNEEPPRPPEYYYYPVLGDCTFSGYIDGGGRLYQYGKYIQTGLPSGVFCTLTYYSVIVSCAKTTTPKSDKCYSGSCEEFWRRIAN